MGFRGVGAVLLLLGDYCSLCKAMPGVFGPGALSTCCLSPVNIQFLVGAAIGLLYLRSAKRQILGTPVYAYSLLVMLFTVYVVACFEFHIDMLGLRNALISSVFVTVILTIGVYVRCKDGQKKVLRCLSWLVTILSWQLHVEFSSD